MIKNLIRVQKQEDLKRILLQKSFAPKFCREQIEYLSPNKGDMGHFHYVPMVAFSDFHILEDLDYFTTYGNSYISFSLEWAQRNNLKKVNYFNIKSQKQMKKVVEGFSSSAKIPSEDYYSKPSWGILEQKIDGKIEKNPFNFSKEIEFRYVPPEFIYDENLSSDIQSAKVRKTLFNETYLFKPLVFDPLSDILELGFPSEEQIKLFFEDFEELTLKDHLFNISKSDQRFFSKYDPNGRVIPSYQLGMPWNL